MKDIEEVLILLLMIVQKDINIFFNINLFKKIIIYVYIYYEE
jgi:hypothetical protein